MIRNVTPQSVLTPAWVSSCTRSDFTEDEGRAGDALIGREAEPHELAEMLGLGYL